jgi:broad specificity phosphatase PhoE
MRISEIPVHVRKGSTSSVPIFLNGQPSMPTNITLICHGATLANRSAAFPLDESLEDRAMAQAAALRATLRRADRAWTSPAIRARQTAAALSLDPVTDLMLRDCDYGRWAGRQLSEVQDAEPEGVAAWLTDTDAAPHGGESIADLLRRVATWLDQHHRDGGHGIAITHATVIRAAILHAIGAPARSFWCVDVGPLSVTDLRSDGASWKWRAIGPMSVE